MRIFLKKVILGISIFSALKAASVEERRVVTFNAATVRQQNTIAEFVDNYLKDSRLRFLPEEQINEIKEILLKLPKWPGGDVVRSYEFIFWKFSLFNTDVGSVAFQPILEGAHSFDFKKISDLKRRHPNLEGAHAVFINFYFSKNEDQDMFIEWLKRFDIKLHRIDCSDSIKLIKCYKKFSDVAAREAFKIWYDRIDKTPYADFSNSEFMTANDIYHSFSDDEERNRFMLWTKKNSSTNSFDFLLSFKNVYCSFQTDEERNRFIMWVNKNQNMNSYYFSNPLISKEIYCAFQADEERARFITWAKEIPGMNYYFSCEPLILKKIYCAFQTDEERARFITWANENPIMNYNFCKYPLVFKEIYCVFQTDEERARFVTWTNAFKSYDILFFPRLSKLYSFFKDNEERNLFMDWANIHLKFIGSIFILKEIYCSFETPEERNHFVNWIKRFGNNIKSMHLNFPHTIIKIYKDPDVRVKFYQYTSIIRSFWEAQNDQYSSVFFFVSQDVINQMRIAATLMAEPNASPSRRRSIQETFIGSPLPLLNPTDPFMQRITRRLGFANAHSFETYYERDAALLSRIVESRGYNADLSDAFLTVYNGQEIKDRYQTNSNVMDFLEYLETEFKEDQHPLDINGHKVSVDDAIHLVKELLGIAPRELSTGAFGSYLARPMLYGTPTAITGDVLLGQVWYLIKTSLLPQESQEVLLRESSSRKRSVVLALLNGIDFDAGKADTRCQTRITGELLEMACFYLGSESSLRRSIADGNDVETSRLQNIEQRIADAPMKAKRIFDAVKESGRFIELYTEFDKPELFELYMCYYDALYQGKTIIGEDGIARRQKDEHVLERDASGNMVRRYNADGRVKENPVIVYYQAEFALIELEFTKFLKREFHENRGLIY